MDTLHFSIAFEQYLLPDGRLAKPFNSADFPSKRILDAYRTMCLIRSFDQKAIALQRTGKLGTYPSILGQEAMGVAIGHALQEDDIFAPYYRDIACQYLRGVSFLEMLLYWGGSERGSDFKQCRRDFPICVPIATQLGHAAGAAVALKMSASHHAALVTCGEGATSKGDFLETLNLAGAWQLPLVIVVNNNQWAISTPRRIQSGAQSIAQKAISAGIPGVIVDGNDYFSVYSEVHKALKKARSGKGATLIEAQSYRLGDHTTADDASRYRSSAELEDAWLKEPIKRLKQFIENELNWTAENEASMQEAINVQIKQSVDAYLNTPAEPATSMFDHLYESLPTGLLDQYAELQAIELLKRYPNARSLLNDDNHHVGA